MNANLTVTTTQLNQDVESWVRCLPHSGSSTGGSLRGKRTHSLGVVVPEMSEGYTAGLMSGVESELARRGYSSLMVSHRSRPELLESSMRLLEWLQVVHLQPVLVDLQLQFLRVGPWCSVAMQLVARLYSVPSFICQRWLVAHVT